jgi:hypothetical protein
VSGNRLVVLLLAIPLLTLLLWQWHQLSQSLWLLSRPSKDLADAAPLSTTSLENQRLCLGIPLLLLGPLEISAVRQPVAVEPQQTAEDEQGGDLDQQVF